jgi:hypothetical protein
MNKKCADKDNGKDLELLYKEKYIMDVKKVDKSYDLFAIKTLDAELNKSAQLTVDNNGTITSINNFINKGKYYNDEPPNIIIKPPASPEGKQAKATANMKKGGDTHNEYWEIKDICISDGGSGYDAIADKDKIEIEKKDTAQKKIVYNEAKPKYYLLEKKESQCNNLTDKWHDWFTIPYYYLGNNNGRRKIDESDKTRNVFKCYKKCDVKYVVNNDNVCESIETLDGGKYRNYIPYDPLAIICILGSYDKADYTATSYVIKRSGVDGVPGNYYHTIEKVKKGDDEDINTEVKDKILASLPDYSSIANHPVATIKTAIDAAYKVISQYITDIITEAEKNDLKIKTIIKNNINDFYQLFDKRDGLYISYLNKLKDSTHFKRVLYAKSIAHKVKDATLLATDDDTTKKYLKYLFNYCKFLYFNENNLFAIRLLNYGIYEKDGYIGSGDTVQNPDDGNDIAKMTESKPDIINYNPVSVKIDTKHKNIFDDYSNAYELYKSFILTYPVILMLSVGLFILVMLLYYINFIYYAASFLNSLYIFVIGVLYFFIVLLVCNSVVIQIVVFVISAIYNTVGFAYSVIMYIFSLTFVRILLFFILITDLLNNNLGVVYGILMFVINTIIYLVFGIISIFLYIIYGFTSGNPAIIFPSFIILSIMYIYYKIWFDFDINTLDKDVKSKTNIINEHSNSTTILKTGVLKTGTGTAISTARLELYKHSYFKNLYEGAYKNYKEKIEEILTYKINKNRLLPDDDNAGAGAGAKIAGTTEELETYKQGKKKKIEEKGKKIDDANIARYDRRAAEQKLRDFNIENDKDLRGYNKEILQNAFNKEETGGIDEIINTKEDLLDRKSKLKKKIRELKTEEKTKRGDVNPFEITTLKGANDGIDSIKSTLGDGLNKGVDLTSGIFDRIKM